MVALVAVALVAAAAAPAAARGRHRRRHHRHHAAEHTHSRARARSRRRARAHSQAHARGAHPHEQAHPQHDKPAKPKTKVFDFTGLSIAGRLRTPQLMYFLERAREELRQASLKRRSFIPEMVQSIDRESL